MAGRRPHPHLNHRTVGRPCGRGLPCSEFPFGYQLIANNEGELFTALGLTSLHQEGDRFPNLRTKFKRQTLCKMGSQVWVSIGLGPVCKAYPATALDCNGCPLTVSFKPKSPARKAGLAADAHHIHIPQALPIQKSGWHRRQKRTRINGLVQLSFKPRNDRTRLNLVGQTVSVSPLFTQLFSERVVRGFCLQRGSRVGCLFARVEVLAP